MPERYNVRSNTFAAIATPSGLFQLVCRLRFWLFTHQVHSRHFKSTHAAKAFLAISRSGK